jgi:DNA-3-methyladenine glycosylase
MAHGPPTPSDVTNDPARVRRVSRAVHRVLPRAFYRRDPRDVAPDLLNKILQGPDGCSARIVETEAYCGAFDEAAHTFGGKTARNATMFGPPGHLYVYFTYGMHWCANTVCGEDGEGVGVLLRAAEPIGGLALMRERRPRAKTDRDLCSGPARLAQAFAIARAQDGNDLVRGRYRIVDDGTPPPIDAVVGPRIGISRAIDAPWRWYVPHNGHVSKR